MVEVTVELVEQDILVTSQAPNRIKAELAVASRFKKAAEEFLAKRGEGPIVIKESTALTTTNSRKFFDYYQTVYPKVDCTVDSRLAVERKGMGSDIPHIAQVIIDGEPIGEPVEMTTTKKVVEDLAFLAAAVFLTKKEPRLHKGFFGALQAGNGAILRPPAPKTMVVDEDDIWTMRKTLFDARRAGLPDEVDDSISDEGLLPINDRRRWVSMKTGQSDLRDNDMKNKFDTYLQDERLKNLRRIRSELPVNQHRAKVLDMVNNNTYSIIVGTTGSGKTTQVPQILLENAILDGRGSKCNIICTQPRRIAATSVARRVSEERAEKLQDTVGYQVRFDAKLPATSGSITFCTTGILLQQLQRSADEVMNNVSYIIVDEVHERDIMIDFLLITLKNIISERAATGRTAPKVVLMSATIDTDHFVSYFKDNTAGRIATDCPTLHVPGRNFPVKERFLDEILDEMKDSKSSSALGIMHSDIPTKKYMQANSRFCQGEPAQNKAGMASAAQDNESLIDWKQERRISENGEIVNLNDELEDSLVPHGLVAATIAHIVLKSDDGAVLVFLPGIDDIVKVDTLLRGTIPGINFEDSTKFKIFMLHSSIPTSQTDVFNRVPLGCRKIILATNIAETSVTIPDVQHVVDTGKHREKQYDQTRRITQLQCTWISKSNSKQRAGRAGRVQNGNYYALFPKARYNAMSPTCLPEMLRSDLQEICLDVKVQALKIPIRDFLSDALDPPSPKAVDSSVLNLQALGALTENEDLTPLGRLLASLPVHPTLGKMIVLGVLFRCLDPMLILGAASAERDLFVYPLSSRSDAQSVKFSFARGFGSDHIAILNAFQEMRELRMSSGTYRQRQFAIDNFIHLGTFTRIEGTARQIEKILVDSGLIPKPDERNSFEFGSRSLNENSHKLPLIKALTLAGMHPNLAIITGGRSLRTPGEPTAMIHPSSVNTPRDRHGEDSINYGSIFTYSTMARSNDGNMVFLRHTTECTPLMAVLFGGKIVQLPRNNRVIEMDDWLPFYVKSMDRSAANIIIQFRKALDRVLAGAFRDLSPWKNSNTGEKVYLADEQTIKIFADGLGELLGGDVGVDGWGPLRGERSTQVKEGDRDTGSLSSHQNIGSAGRWDDNRGYSNTRVFPPELAGLKC